MSFWTDTILPFLTKHIVLVDNADYTISFPTWYIVAGVGAFLLLIIFFAIMHKVRKNRIKKRDQSIKVKAVSVSTDNIVPRADSKETEKVEGSDDLSDMIVSKAVPKPNSPTTNSYLQVDDDEFDISELLALAKEEENKDSTDEQAAQEKVAIDDELSEFVAPVSNKTNEVDNTVDDLTAVVEESNELDDMIINPSAEKIEPTNKEEIMAIDELDDFIIKPKDDALATQDEFDISEFTVANQVEALDEDLIVVPNVDHTKKPAFYDSEIISSTEMTGYNLADELDIDPVAPEIEIADNASMNAEIAEDEEKTIKVIPKKVKPKKPAIVKEGFATTIKESKSEVIVDENGAEKVVKVPKPPKSMPSKKTTAKAVSDKATPKKTPAKATTKTTTTKAAEKTPAKTTTKAATTKTAAKAPAKKVAPKAAVGLDDKPAKKAPAKKATPKKTTKE